MFTGLVEHVVTISSITPAESFEGFTFTFKNAAPILDDCHIGDSICVNGACLTVTEFDEDTFKVGLAPETLNRTNLGQLKVGDKVNVERAMAAHTRFGGHMVQGHVDATAEIVSRVADGNSIRYTFAFPSTSKSNFMPYLIEKGYVTIDGASLTLTHVSPVSSPKREFGIMLIAHSQEKLTLTSKDVGGTVNVEVDCVGKYVLRSLEGEDAEGEGQGGLRALVERMVERKINERLGQQ
ncbi:hypothetical protein FFLO_00900 [Filobasidium floriforme]|uniref:Riboflavin synthase n=1 Tax=Filobasidium floriforme TaxID=5210 RepID=A0A8K0NTE4_9TREE|nr:riboflavin synthase [Filobasidium floriforme]KAG7571227.1 hypothetical protein FFLO_00900 [Filobasidium floriforme]KAH8087068.1 riboflavin synthase [Filobasidium floriforme]